MPVSLGKLDWSLWFYGLWSAFVGGGAGAAGAAIAAIALDPSHFNLNEPWPLFKLALTTFLVSGLAPFFAYLKQQPLPPIITVTETKTTSLQHDPTAIVEQTIKTTEVKPAEEQPK